MYSIVDKKGSIVKILAESDKDLLYIVDSCGPGSTVEVLGETADKKHTYIMSPSGKWVIYEGEAEDGFTMPKNDVKVSAPADKDAFPKNRYKKIEEYQRGVQIYPTGLVTGVLLNNSVDENSDYPEEQRTGHYVTVFHEAPEKATKYEIWTMGQKRKDSELDGYLTVRMENMTEDKEITIKYDSGEEFTFILDQLKLQ